MRSERQINVIIFQILYGAIKSIDVVLGEFDQEIFQFLCGTIKSGKKYYGA